MKKKPSGRNKKHLFSAIEIWRSNQLLWRWFCPNVGVDGYDTYFLKDFSRVRKWQRQKQTKTEIRLRENRNRGRNTQGGNKRLRGTTETVRGIEIGTEEEGGGGEEREKGQEKEEKVEKEEAGEEEIILCGGESTQL